MSTVKVGPLGQPPVNVVADQLELLMSSLHVRGLHYAAVVQLNSDQSLPVIASTSPFELITVGVADHDVVLVRSDLPVSQLKVERVQMQHYAAAVVLPIDQDNQLAIPRGWIAVDVKLRGKVYRFVDTHLETLDPVVQGKQATELVNGPLATGLPVVLGGDLNSDANKPGSPFPAYGIVVDSGMTDVWNVVRTGQDGSTWPLFFEDPVTPSPGPVERIDLVLIKGAIRPVAIERTGLEMPYASDHAGVAASLMLLP